MQEELPMEKIQAGYNFGKLFYHEIFLKNPQLFPEHLAMRFIY